LNKKKVSIWFYSTVMWFGDSKMDNRLPAYFQLSRYSITPQAVVKTVLHCDPDSIQTRAIVTAVWDVDVFATHLESMSEISKGVVY